MKFLISIMIWVIGSIITMAVVLASRVLSILLLPFKNREDVVHAQCFWWSDALVALNPFWKLTVKGLENIDHSKTYVIVANHQSLADIVVIYKIHMRFKWVARESLLKVPLIGSLLKVGNHILFSRGSFSSVKEVYRKAAKQLKGGMSVLFFPEGTRSDTDEMKEFQNGAFKLAIKEKMPILPISISGTREAIPKGGWIFKAKVFGKLEVMPAIDTSGFKMGDFARLRDLTREKLKSAI